MKIHVRGKGLTPGYRVLETDNYDREYKAEQYACPYVFTHPDNAKHVADALNKAIGHGLDQYWCVCTTDYVLKDGDPNKQWHSVP